jgi:hypothetical protein
MRFFGMKEFSEGRPAQLLTRPLYVNRGDWANHYRAKFEAAKRADGTPKYGSRAELKKHLYKTKNVVDISVLNSLPYFDIAWHTLLDMMHINANIVKQATNLLGGERNKRYAGETGVTDLEVPELPDYEGMTPAEAKAASKKFGVDSARRTDDIERRAKHKVLAESRIRFRCNGEESAALEAAYGFIQAPINIAPRSKRPIEAPGQMTAHQWVNFAKVYGKYLFLKMYSREQDTINKGTPSERNAPLEAMCRLMDLLTSCLSSNATAALKVKMVAQARAFAARFDQHFPESELTVMMHVLVHHIPSLIQIWGPVRGFWCFPFER